MCIIKQPKTVAVASTEDKQAPVLRNPYLDGIDPVIRSRMTGLKSLRVDAPRTGRNANPAVSVAPASGSNISPTSTSSQRAALGLTVGVKPTAGI